MRMTQSQSGGLFGGRQTQTMATGDGGGFLAPIVIAVGVLFLLAAAATALAAAAAAVAAIVKLILWCLVGAVAFLGFAALALALYRARFALARYGRWALSRPEHRQPVAWVSLNGLPARPARIVQAPAEVPELAAPPALDDVTLDALAARVAEHLRRDR